MKIPKSLKFPRKRTKELKKTFKLFERVDCPNCNGKGSYRTGEDSWTCRKCGSDNKVFKYNILLNLLKIIILIIIVSVLMIIIPFLNYVLFGQQVQYITF